MFVYLATELQKLGHRALFLSSDINSLAASVAQRTAVINGVEAFGVARTDLLQCFEPRIQVCVLFCPDSKTAIANGRWWW